jgi:hypothetical protein
MYDLVISITAWNVRELLRGCLASIFDNPPKQNCKVVVLDDQSSDGTSDMVRREFPAADLIVSEKNLGFIGSNNFILKRYEGQARYYLLLNADTVVQPGALDALLKFADEHLEAGIVGGKLVKPDGTLDWPCKRSFQTPSVFFYRALGLDKLFPKSPRFGRHHLTYLDENETHEVDAVCGALLMIRGETLQRIGLMDKQLFMYSDDIDWCFRARVAGWKVFYYPRSVVIHYKSASNRKRPFRMIYWWYRSTWIVYRKSLAPRYNRLTNGTVFLGMHFMLGVSLLRNLLRASKMLPSRK